MPIFNQSQGKKRDFFYVKNKGTYSMDLGLLPGYGLCWQKDIRKERCSVSRETQPQALGFLASPACHVPRISTKSKGQTGVDITANDEHASPSQGKVRKTEELPTTPKFGHSASKVGCSMENRVAISLPA